MSGCLNHIDGSGASMMDNVHSTTIKMPLLIGSGVARGGSRGQAPVKLRPQ